MSTRSSWVLFALALATGCLPDLLVAKPKPSEACDQGGMELLAEAFPICSPGLCGPDKADGEGGRCVPTDLVTPASSRKDLQTCADGKSLCVPLTFLFNEGRYTPKTCRSVAGIEGRCLSPCLAEIHKQSDALYQGSCDKGELCAPCYDPSTGKKTSACTSNACDQPVEPEPQYCDIDYEKHPAVLLSQSAWPVCPAEVCSTGKAHCLPNALVEKDLAQLKACDDAHACVPDEQLLTAGNFKPQECTAGGGIEGRCLSVCLKDIDKDKDSLLPGGCPSGQLCAPCYDPRNGKRTPACGAEPKSTDEKTACDAPKDEKPNFCELDYVEHPLVDVNKYPLCPTDVCATGKARCVPNALAGDDLEKLLPCSETEVCVPEAQLRSGGNLKPQRCQAGGGIEGRCLSECLADIQKNKKSLVKGDCQEEGELCAPCYRQADGVESEVTEACNAASENDCDQMEDPAPNWCELDYVNHPLIDVAKFPTCSVGMCGQGGGSAHCVPEDLIPNEDDRDQFLKCEDCSGLCVPDVLLETGGNKPVGCRSIRGEAEGRCQSTCLPEVAKQAVPDGLPVDVCAPDERCAPCFDPRDGTSTGACETSCDAPQEPAWKFPSCCGEKAKCVPTGLAGEKASSLAQDSCLTAEKCVPNEYFVPDGEVYEPIACSRPGAFFEETGACLSNCIPTPLDDVADATWQDARCGADARCVPCSLLLFLPTGACDKSKVEDPPKKQCE